MRRPWCESDVHFWWVVGAVHDLPVPETAGRTYGELDEMFMRKVPARKFKGYTTDADLGTATKEGANSIV